MRKCAENNKLCGNVRRTVNCAIPHPSHLIGASAGVVYRPPSGNIQDAHAELDVLMKFLPSNNAALTGDFNFDLLAQGRDIAEFEQTIYKSTVKI